MDALDIQIIRTMGIRPYEREPKDPDVLKPSHIARVLDTTANTVKARIARMEQRGVIASYRLVPNLRHLDLTAEAYHFKFGDVDRKDAAMEHIATLDGLLEVHDFLGPDMCVDFAFREPGELQRKLSTLSEHTGDRNPRKFYEREMPPVERALTNLDWRILQALRGDATRSLYDVGDDLGVSGRTVKRRHDRMAAEGSFFTVPLVDPSKAQGLLLFEILIYLEPGADGPVYNAIHKALDDRQVYAYVPASRELGHFDLLLFAKNSGEVEALRQKAEAVPGVERAEAWLFRSFNDHSAWIDDAIATRIEKTTD